MAEPVCVHAVVVTYRSDAQRLAEQFERLLAQVQAIVWVDNGSENGLRALAERWSAEQVHQVWLENNQGIGAAQNRGIDRARQCGATHVLLMDDDSLPASDMVAHLLAALKTHPQMGAAGACHADSRRQVGRTPFSVIRGARLQWLPCTDAQQVWEVDHVIASGCLIPMPVLQSVGGMREDFFIDWVDTEWCLRARGQGWRIVGVCAAVMEHRLGDRMGQVWGHEIPRHAPWRHYYQARNFILMLRSAPIGQGAKVQMTYRQFKRFLVFSLLMPGRGQYFRMWLRGLWHGMVGKSGKWVAPGHR